MSRFKKTALLSCILVAYLSLAHAQEFYIGLETGIRTFDSQPSEYDFIRQEAIYYYGYHYSSSEINWMSYAPDVSLKAEWRSSKDKLWISSGLSYSALYSSMKESNYSGDGSPYLYFRLEQSENQSDYYRVKGIYGWDHYIGIPLELRYSPFVPRFFRLYFKLGIDFNFKLGSKQEVDFFDPDMKVHEQEILDLFPAANIFYSSASAGIGMQLGRQNKPNFRAEADLPLLFLTPGAFSLMEHHFGTGLSISFIVPLKSK